MKLKILIYGVLLMMAASAPSAVSQSGIYDGFDSFGAADCEEEMARLDNLAIELQHSPEERAYIFIYGGRRGTLRNEVKVRAARMKRYLIETRSIKPEQFEIIKGGYRESLAVVIVIFPRDQPAPTASPTVNPKAVRFKRGRMALYREPGCYPGTYLKEKARAK